jgi:hypothetical protein
MQLKRRFSGFAVIALCMTQAAAWGQAPKMAPIPIELPKPGYEGTPENTSGIKNLEPSSTRLRPAFLAPAGVTNIARGKKVTSSEKEPVVGDLDMVNDGDKSQVDGNYVELGAGPQWIQIDLEKPSEIYAVVMWHHFQPRVYFDVVVQTADDDAFTKNVQTWFNNDAANELKRGAGKNQNYFEDYQGKLVDTKGVQARYVRFYSNGNATNDFNNYVEVEVFGKPVGQ